MIIRRPSPIVWLAALAAAATVSACATQPAAEPAAKPAASSTPAPKAPAPSGAAAAAAQPMTPPALQHVVQGALMKDPEARWQSAADIARQLRWIRSPESSSSAVRPSLPHPRSRERLLWATLVGLVAYYSGDAAASAIQTYGLYAAGAIAVGVVAIFLGLRWWERRMIAEDS